jgi:prepilin-type N-terminal cleavage/methylation domain-containing protein
MYALQNSVRRPRPASRRGLTLLELVVVLLILTALAGLLVPVLANMTTRTHGAAGAANVAEIAKAVQTHEALYNEYPAFFDSLIDDAGEVVVDETNTYLADIDLGADPLGARIADALLRVGIDGSYQHLAASTNKTFEPYADPPVFVAITDAPAGQVVTLTPDAITQLGLAPLSLDPTEGVQAYVAFGLGALSNMVGRSMIEAPVHFPESGESPVEEYSRFILVYAVPANGPARLASVAAGHEEGLSGMNSHLAEYYSTQQ